MDACRSQQPPGKQPYKENGMKADVLVSLAIFTRSHLKAVGKRPAFNSIYSVGRNLKGGGYQQAFTWPAGSTELGVVSLPAEMSTINATAQQLSA